MQTRNLGKVTSIHGVAPQTLQKVAIVAFLSFVFFLAMLVGFYVRQQMGYFLLSTGFLVVYVLTMIGWIAMRRQSLKVCENGIALRKFEVLWSEISAVESLPRKGMRIAREDGASVLVAESLADFDAIAETVRWKSGK